MRRATHRQIKPRRKRTTKTESTPVPGKSIAHKTLPDELRAAGWKLARHVKNDDEENATFTVSNETLKLTTKAFKAVDDAIAAASDLYRRSAGLLPLGTPPPSQRKRSERKAEATPVPLLSKLAVDITGKQPHPAMEPPPPPELLGSADQILLFIPIDNIETRGQPRQIFNEVKLQELATSIGEKGIVEPLIVRAMPRGWRPVTGEGVGADNRRRWQIFTAELNGGTTRFIGAKTKEEAQLAADKRNRVYGLVAGERRLRAAKLAKLPIVPCIVRTLSDKQADEIQIIENDQREDLNAIERGAGYQKLMERHGHTPETLAAAVGKSKTFIHDQLKLAKLPPDAAKALVEETLPKSTATLIARIPSEKLRIKAADQILHPKYERDLLSYRAAKELIDDEFTVQLKGAPFDRNDAQLVPAAGACTSCPKLCGNNRAEFPDARADVCTDPPCCRQKLAAHDARTRDLAKEKEITVLPAAMTTKLFNSWNNDLVYNSGYLDLAEQCRLDKQKKKRSYKQLIGDAVAPVMAIDRNHHARFLVPIKPAAEALKRKHKIDLQYTPTSSGHTSNYEAQERERKRKEEEFKVLCMGAASEIVAKAEESETFSAAELRLLLKKYLSYDEHCLAERRQLIAPGQQSAPRLTTNAIKSAVDKMPLRKLKGLLIELTFWHGAQMYSQQPDDTAKAILGLYGVNLKKSQVTKAKPTAKVATKAKAARSGK